MDVAPLGPPGGADYSRFNGDSGGNISRYRKINNIPGIVNGKMAGLLFLQPPFPSDFFFLDRKSGSNLYLIPFVSKY